MKQVFKLAPLAVAVAALSLSGVAIAGSDGPSNDGPRKHHRDGAHLSKHVHVSKKVEYKGDVAIDGRIRVNSLGMSVIDQEQDSDGNLTINDRVDNNATLDGNALRDSKGNMGINVSAGDHNVQSNAAALSAADASFVFGSADAEIFMDQNAEDNVAFNWGTINNADFGDDALRGAKGNIGVNVTAGSSNVQANSFAASVASGSMGEATVSVKQETENNMVHNLPEETYEVITTRVTMSGGMSGGYSGNGNGSYSGTNYGAGYSGVNHAARYSGRNGPATYSGTSSQSNDVYPEVWINGSGHEQGGASYWGHIDYDNDNVSPGGANDDPGRFEFDESGTISGSSEGGVVGAHRESGRIGRSTERGTLNFSEAGTQSLSGTFTGSVEHLITRYVRHENNASLGDNALRGAKGNIGVNVTAGTSNLQNNSLAMTKIDALDTMPEPPVGNE
ncbi:hypothetical protein [Amphritea balenae]|uniref:Adhesin n=1 Tax=Amphritea balenae TaxID=452629 RepID=A0A3P1SHC5_9GAMM|nr:hypothetical protein [Amphritea balenae]RRC96683.1 hypothetical protein EHS89_20665 [Amphritea balenae]GGK84514.1 hypothetical protein GCM10007941_38780 [Amphritea balenae]